MAGIASKNLQAAQNTVLSDAASPFRFYLTMVGKSITGVYADEKITEESEKLLKWRQGMTAFFPTQAKFFADGAWSAPVLDMVSLDWLLKFHCEKSAGLRYRDT